MTTIDEEPEFEIPVKASLDRRRYNARSLTTECPVSLYKQQENEVTDSGAIEVMDGHEDDDTWAPHTHHYRDAGLRNAQEVADDVREREGVKVCLFRDGTQLDHSRATLRDLTTLPPTT